MKLTIRHVCTAALVALLLTTAGCDLFVSAEGRVERAQRFVDQGEYRRALVELKNALQKEPELREARALLAEVALWLGDAASAQTELARASAGAGADEYADLATRIDLALGRPKQVLERLSKAPPTIEPARAALYRGLALQSLNQPDAARVAFEAAARLDPALIDAHVGIAETLVTRDGLSSALAISEKLVREHPQSALAWFTHGALLARGGQTSVAQEALIRARDLGHKQLEVPRQVALLSILVDVQLADRNIEAARTSAQAVSRLVPNSPLALLVSARISMAANDYTAAATELRRVVNGSPQLVQGRYMLGIALAAQGNLEQASQELNQVVQQAPQNAEARQLLAQVRMRLNDPDGALRVLVPALQSNADDLRLNSLVEGVRALAGADRSTIELLERALAETPNSAGLQLQLASAYLQAGAADKAAELLRRTSADGVAGDARRQALLLQAIARAEGTPAARAQIDALVAAHPADPNVVGLAAIFYARLGDLQKGRALLTNALTRQPNDTTLLLTLGRLEWSAQRAEAAREALERLLSIDPKHEPGRFALAELYLARGDEAAATQHLETLRQADPRAAEPRLLLARLALGHDDVKTADALIAETVKGAAGRIDVINAAGLLYLDTGRFDQAMALFRDGTVADPGNPVLWLNLGRSQLALNQAGAAQESLQRALSVRPDWLPAIGALAFLEVQQGRGAAALERVAALKQTKRDDPAVLTLEGEIYAVLRRFKEAAQSFEAAAAVRPSGVLAAKIYQARLAGQLPQPLVPLEKWMQQHPEDVGLRSLLAEGYITLGESQRAVEQYRQILQAQPRHLAALNNLAWLYYQLKDERALETARAANALAPQSAAVSDTLGWILVEQGRVEEGLPILQKAAAQPQASGEIKYHYAAALARAGSAQQARTVLAALLGEHAPFDSRDAAQRLLDQLSAGGAVTDNDDARP